MFCYFFKIILLWLLCIVFCWNSIYFLCMELVLMYFICVVGCVIIGIWCVCFAWNRVLRFVICLCRSRSRKVADNICSQSHFGVEVSWDQSLRTLLYHVLLSLCCRNENGGIVILIRDISYMMLSPELDTQFHLLLHFPAFMSLPLLHSLFQNMPLES
jgi:hypothetical protein